MDWDWQGTNEDFRQQQDDIIEAFNNALSMLLARMTTEQMKIAVEDKSDLVLNNIFKSAYNREEYEVCHVIKQVLDNRKVNGQ